ncbi:T9SS type A sorting domain-containing protein [Hymenobacter guriensis]|uniref:T9SS type A sorting domain-containing protein n=1 Tax=Hymenobacter guriensis TaxID=2793065 RepID=A0ABS0L5I5_9BACT|nr:T9SS type A sorting domain-containing protein [Hymenobacter guriensis]MBG8555180.1 T9SS type A sorting domain-containing protein [Hymenobacter guriensis]
MKTLLLLAGLSAASVYSSNAQDLKPASVPARRTVCYASRQNTFTRVAPPEQFLRVRALKGRGIDAANVTVTYTGFTPAAKEAFQYAVDIWASLLKSEVPIHINANWTPLAEGVLGSAGPSTYYRNVDGVLQSNVWYPVALAEKLSGEQLNAPSEADIEARFSSTFNWYLGTDGKTPAGQYDLVTVVLHELGHGLGFVDAMDVQEGEGSHGYSSLPVVYDTFVENAAEQRLVDKTIFPNPSEALAQQITSKELFFDSPLARAVNGNNRPKLYAPATFEAGSSVAHLDENLYPASNVNSLMSPQIGAAEAIHSPGPLVLKMFDEMGWFATTIHHTPLRDTETAQDFVVKAIIKSDGTVQAGSAKLVYSINGGTNATVSLTANGNANEYSATIPNPGLGATVRYALSVADQETGRTYLAPGKAAPGVEGEPRYEFRVGPDKTVPEVAHEAPSFLFESELPYQIVALADDNIGISKVEVEYSVNGVARPAITLAKTDEFTYTGLLGAAGDIKAGDIVTYRIVAEDVAAARNTTSTPTYTLSIVKLKEAQVSYSNQLDSNSPLDFVGNGFSITQPDGFSSPAIHSLHPYPDGAGPNSESNFIYQLLVPIKVREAKAEATVRFDEIVLVEPGATGSVFGSPDFFDYVVVEGSENGTTWVPLANGYDSRASAVWRTAYNSSISGDNSTAVGTPTLFRSRLLNLRNQFAGGDVVQLRFRLFADAGAHGWGWAIDNLRIQDAVTGVADELQATGGFSVFPNPTSGRFTVQARLAKATPGLQVVVRNVLGQEVLRKAVRETPGQLHETIDLGGLANGLYLVSLGTGADVLTKRVMVQK